MFAKILILLFVAAVAVFAEPCGLCGGLITPGLGCGLGVVGARPSVVTGSGCLGTGLVAPLIAPVATPSVVAPLVTSGLCGTYGAGLDYGMGLGCGLGAGLLC